MEAAIIALLVEGLKQVKIWRRRRVIFLRVGGPLNEKQELRGCMLVCSCRLGDPEMFV